MDPIIRPMKTSGARTFVDERVNGFPIIEAAEVDKEFDQLVEIFNTGAFPLLPPLEANVVGSANLTDLAVTTPKIANGAVTQAKLATASVGNLQLIDGSVTEEKIVSLPYTKILGVPTTLPPSGPAGGDVAGSTFPTLIVAPGKITRAKLGPDVAVPAALPTGGDVGEVVTVTAAGVVDYAPLPAQAIVDGAVTTPKIADGAVTNAKIASVAFTKITGAPTAYPPIANSVGQANLTVNAVANANLQAEAVTLDKIDQDSVPLPPVPTHGDLGRVLSVIEQGTPNVPKIAWVDPWTLDLTGTGGTGGDVIWTQDTDQLWIRPFVPKMGVQFDGQSTGIQFAHTNYPTIDRRTGMSADDGTLRLYAGSASIDFMKWDASGVLMQLLSTGELSVLTNNGIKVGKSPARGRLSSVTTTSVWTHNVQPLGNAIDDPANPAWGVVMKANAAGPDNFEITHSPPGATATYTTLLLLDNVGKLTIGADPVNPLDVVTKQYADALGGGGGGGDLWTIAGSTITPIDPTKTVRVPAVSAFNFGPGLMGTLDCDGGLVDLGFNHPWAVQNMGIGSWLLEIDGNTVNWFRRNAGAAVGDAANLWQLGGNGDVYMAGTNLFVGQRGYVASDTHALNLVGNSPGSPGYVSALKTWSAILDYENDHFDVQRDGVTLLSVLATGRIRATVDPTNALDLATKQYVDTVSVAARVTRSVVFSVPNAAYTAIPFDTESFDRGNCWAVGTPTRMLLPVPGVYLITAQVYFDVNATGSRSISVANKAAVELCGMDDLNGGAGAYIGLTVSTIYLATDPTDYIQVSVYQGSGAPLNLLANKAIVAICRLGT